MPSALVTGASRGIGRAISLHLAGTGWDVFAGVRDAASAPAGERITPVQLDVTDAAHVAALPAALPRGLDAVVNNAGIVVGGPVEGVPADEWRRQLDVNVVGQVAVTQAVLPLIRDARGRVVFISSLSGRVATPMTGAYNASKFALEAVADSLRLEVGPWGIAVVLVEPAQTDTALWQDAEEALEDQIATLTPDARRLYERHIEGFRRSIPRSQKMATPAEGVADVVERALTVRRPKARYVVGRGPRVQALMAGLLPTAVLDRALRAATGVPRKL